MKFAAHLLLLLLHQGAPQPQSGQADRPRIRLIEPGPTAEGILEAARRSDSDGDGVNNAEDNCKAVANPKQLDSDANGVGDACEIVGMVDLTLRAHVTPSPVMEGAFATYEIAISNVGARPSSQTWLSFELPKGISPVSTTVLEGDAECRLSAVGADAHPSTGGTVNCRLGRGEPGSRGPENGGAMAARSQVRIAVRVRAEAAGNFNQLLGVGAAQPDADSRNNRAAFPVVVQRAGNAAGRGPDSTL